MLAKVVASPVVVASSEVTGSFHTPQAVRNGDHTAYLSDIPDGQGGGPL